MQTAVERVMQTYAMMVDLTSEQQELTRKKLEQFLVDKTGSDNELAVQGLQFLRGARHKRPRRQREAAE